MRIADFIFHILVAMMLIPLALFGGKESIFFILILQFSIGVFQVISSLIRTFRFYSFDRTIQKLIIGYWVLCALYALVLICVSEDMTFLKSFFFAGWGIAVYYCTITYFLVFPKYAKSHLDI